jgi:hypothetical protein
MVFPVALFIHIFSILISFCHCENVLPLLRQNVKSPDAKNMTSHVSYVSDVFSNLKLPSICLLDARIEQLSPQNWHRLSIDCLVEFQDGSDDTSPLV